MAVEYFQRFEKQNAHALTFLITVQSIDYTNNDQAINVCNLNWRPYYTILPRLRDF